MLGTYLDRRQADDMAQASRDVGADGLLQRAFAEYEFNATFPHPGGQVENLDGEMVTIFDEDANL